MEISHYRVETLTPKIGIDYSDNKEVLEQLADAYRTIIKVFHLYF